MSASAEDPAVVDVPAEPATTTSDNSEAPLWARSVPEFERHLAAIGADRDAPRTFTHDAAKTVADHAKFLPVDDGVGRVKNLFLCSKRTATLVLVSALVDTQVSLQNVQRQLHLVNKDFFRFASAELLQKHLKVAEGSLNPFCIACDTYRQVFFLLDPKLLSCEYVHVHPMTCCATTTISLRDLKTFWNHHNVHYQQLPEG
ncbi:hypothetical protein Pelo_1924 [Pelomyxa schiedti]|nr:hypothetical protein Pelo_1924 [Pelomyxa schiedti]